MTDRDITIRQPLRARGTRIATPATPVPEIDLPVGRLAKALVFICGVDHPATVATQKAATTNTPDDAAKARKLFQKLKPSLQQAALAMLEP